MRTPDCNHLRRFTSARRVYKKYVRRATSLSFLPEFGVRIVLVRILRRSTQRATFVRCPKEGQKTCRMPEEMPTNQTFWPPDAHKTPVFGLFRLLGDRRAGLGPAFGVKQEKIRLFAILSRAVNLVMIPVHGRCMFFLYLTRTWRIKIK